MGPTNVELYEMLKPSIGEDAARMIAEVVPPSRDLALRTDVFAVRSDVDALRTEFAEFRGEMRAEFAEFRGEMRAEFAEFRGEMRTEMRAGQVNMLKWMIGLVVPVWLSSFATVVALLVKA